MKARRVLFSKNLHTLANPARFVRLGERVFLPFLLGALVLGGGGLIWGFFFTPADYQQGDAFRIMYVHVPAAYMSMFIYSCLAIGNIGFLIWRHPLAAIAASASAPIGAGFTALTLLTGSLWGKPMWGTWWVWDARLTSVLVLLFLYLAYMALVHAFDDRERGRQAGAVLSLVGLINIPVIKFSVTWWNTLHQPASISRLGAPGIDTSMLWPLILVILGFTLYYFAVLLVRIKLALLQHKRESLLRLMVSGK